MLIGSPINPDSHVNNGSSDEEMKDEYEFEHHGVGSQS